MSENDQVEAFRAEMRETFKTIAGDVNQIKGALVGNDMGTTGIIPRLATAEHEIVANKQAIEIEKTRVNLKLAWVGGASGVIVLLLSIIEIVGVWRR